MEVELQQRMQNLRFCFGTFCINVTLSKLPDLSCLHSTGKSEHHDGDTVISRFIKHMDTFYKINILH